MVITISSSAKEGTFSWKGVVPPIKSKPKLEEVEKDGVVIVTLKEI